MPDTSLVKAIFAPPRRMQQMTKAFPSGLASVESRGWWPIIRESTSGAWQRNQEITVDTVLTFGAVFACVTLIASDIAKMRLRIVELDSNGIWNEVDVPAFSPVLRKPNRYQTRIQFVESWMNSKLIHGNTYALKQRDERNTVAAMYLLDPLRVRPLVAPDGAVFYELKKDLLSQLEDDNVIVPASEIMHDRWNCLYHPLVGVSPIHAAGLAALQGIRIQNNSTVFFANGAQPGGVLTAPGAISQETADRIKARWETEFGGVENSGKVAVLGDGLKYEGMMMKSTDAQLIEQLRWTAENVCTCFHVPAYMVGVGPPPNYNNIEALNQQYYSQCLQILIESKELVLDEGFGLAPDKVNGRRLGTEFDIDDLLRMDSATLMTTVKDGVGAGIFSPNEGRKKFNLSPKQGGESPYLQQQNFSIAALARRDAQRAAPDSSSDAETAPNAEPTDNTEAATGDVSAKGMRGEAFILARKSFDRGARVA